MSYILATVAAIAGTTFLVTRTMLFKLVEASIYGDASTVESIIDQDRPDNDYLDLALVCAAFNGHLNVIKVLHAAGADISIKDDYPLRLAAGYNYPKIVEWLLKHDANVHANDDYSLRVASRYNYLKVVEILLKHDANVHANDDCALRMACKYKHLDVAQILLEHGANTYAKSDAIIRDYSKLVDSGRAPHEIKTMLCNSHKSHELGYSPKDLKSKKE